MKTTRTFLLSFALMVLAACGGERATPEPAAPEAATAADATPAEMHDGVQVVDIDAGPLGYRPQRIALKEDVPARLIFTRTADSACTEQVQSEDLGIAPTTLPLNEPVAIEFTPDEAGEYTFTCGMGMIHGIIVVGS